MKRIFIPTKNGSDWQGLRAKPKLHWKKGASAMTAAAAWEGAGSVLSQEIAIALNSWSDWCFFRDSYPHARCLKSAMLTTMRSIPEPIVGLVLDHGARGLIGGRIVPRRSCPFDAEELEKGMGYESDV